MPNGLPEPALSPLHPDKPEPPIVAGDVWQKIATGTKTSKNAPTCSVFHFHPTWAVPVRVYHLTGPLTGKHQDMTERVFRRDWRPC